MGTGTHDPPARLPTIPAVPATIEDLGDRLVMRAGLDPADLIRLIDPPDPRALSDPLVQVAQDATSVLMFYYVGHGVISPHNELHLATRATADLTKGVPAYQALPYSVLHEVLSQCPAELVVVVLDCCFAGRAQGVSHDSVNHVFDTTWSGAYLLTSSSRDEVSWALPGARNTVFSGELIHLLDEGDPAGPPMLTLDHVYRCLAHTLPRKGFPRPRRQATDLGDRCPFVVNPAYHAPTAPGAPQPVRSGKRDEGDEEESPYRGLSVFGPQDEDMFYGREELTLALVKRLEERRRAGGPLLVTGPSGSGKSSLLQAGVIPLVRREAGGCLPYVVFTPGTDPVWELARRIAFLTDRVPENLRALIETDPGELRRALATISGHPLIVADQFEELFTVCQDESRRRTFIEALADACRLGEGGQEPPATVVIGIRADFFGYCASYAVLLEALKHPEIVGPMTTAQLREIIEKPAEHAGLGLEEGLADLLLEDLGADDLSGAGLGGALPLLSHALLSTWQRRTGRLLTLAAYRASGGISRSLALSADETLRRLSPDAQAVAHQMLLRMVHLDDRTDDTRRRVALHHLVGEQQAAVRDVLGAFVNARLVTVSEDTAELTHETLIHAWPRLRTWIDTDRASLLVRQHLAADAEAWDRHSRDPAYLYRDSRLVMARTAVDNSPGTEPASLEKVFLDMSTRRSRRRRRVVTGAITALTVLFLFAVSMALIAKSKNDEATRRSEEVTRQRNRAIARQLVDTANRMQDKSLRAYFALAAYDLARLPETLGAVLSARTWPTSGRLYGHTGPVLDLAFSPDGRTLASASADRTVRLWNVNDAAHPRQAYRLDADDEMRGVAFRADGRVLATSSHDGTMTLWNSENPRAPRRVSSSRVSGKGLGKVAFAPHGGLLAVVSGDHTVRLWDASDATRPRQVFTLGGHSGEVQAIAFSPDGKRLATASLDHTALLWDVSNPTHPRLLAPLRKSTKALETLAFTPDGNTLATGGQGARIWTWDIRDPKHPKPSFIPFDQDTPIHDLAFSADGKTLAVASSDMFVHLWNLTQKGKPRIAGSFQGHANDVSAVAINPRSGVVATGSADHLLRLWRVDDVGSVPYAPPLFRYEGEKAANDLALSPDGREIASGSDDATWQLWDVRDPAHPTPLITKGKGHRSSITKVAFRPDGRSVATASDDGTVRLWDVSDPRKARAWSTIPASGQKVSAVLFSRDGRIVITASEDRTVCFWDTAEPLPPKLVVRLTPPGSMADLALTPDGHVLAMASYDGKVYLYDVRNIRLPVALGTTGGNGQRLLSVDLSPDGQTLVTAARDGTAYLWKISDPVHPRKLTPLTGHAGVVTGGAFSADGRTLATIGADARVQLWDITDLRRPRRYAILQKDNKPLYSVVFTPGGTLITAAADGWVRTWSPNLKEALRYICERNGTSSITPDEWKQYVPDLHYNPPCQ